MTPAVYDHNGEDVVLALVFGWAALFLRSVVRFEIPPLSFAIMLCPPSNVKRPYGLYQGDLSNISLPGPPLLRAPRSRALERHKSLYPTTFPLVLRMDNVIFEDPSKPRVRPQRHVHVEPASSGVCQSSSIRECINEVQPPDVAPISNIRL